MQPLVLGLGNDLLADDAIGILAARELKERLGNQAEVVDSSLSGLALLDLMIGYRQAIIIDAICTGRATPGTIMRLNHEDLSQVVAPTPHYAGLPELFALARRLELEFPQELVIFTVEVADPLTVGGAMTPVVRRALPGLIEQVQDQVERWHNEPS
ncbi:MAG: hydrogenase maturation protease [Calditrichaeota bacterium]|nr:hydrogenase maturation protease [Calditrichota bacterium]